jgi:CheY-like chemotaxis protein
VKLKQATVLFVEDEPFLRETMSAWLKHKTGRTLCAENGAEAVKLLASNKIDLVLSDVRMPVMDGLALVKKINQAENHKPGVIFLTGFSDLSLREVYEMGVDAIVEKPIHREELLRAMQHSLAGADELWRQTPAHAPAMKLKTSFPSLAGAMQDNRIAFGRRGFCIRPAGVLREGPLDFAVAFKADHRVLSGQGVVRWTAPQEGQAGIEITHMDAASRSWVLDLVKRSAPLAFIPASTSTKTRHSPSSKAA